MKAHRADERQSHGSPIKKRFPVLRYALGIGLALASASCSGGGSGSTQSSPDGGVFTSADEGGSGSLSVSLLGSSTPVYPCVSNCGSSSADSVVLHYLLTVTNGGPGLQDLRIVVPVPKGVSSATIEGGVSTGTRVLQRDIDWLPAGGSLQADVSFDLGYRLFASAQSGDALQGDFPVTTQATVLQYDVPLARSEDATDVAYLLAKVSPQDIDIYSGSSDGKYLYVSGRLRSGPNVGQGGIHRIALSDGTLVHLAAHAMSPSDMLPFFLDGSSLYYVTHTTDPLSTVLMKIASDGSGTPTPVPLPAGTLNVRAVSGDAMYLFLILEAADHAQYVYRSTKSDPAGASASSAALGTLVANTMAVTSNDVVVMRADMPSVWRMDKVALVPTKLADIAGVAYEQTLACDDTDCFWVDGGALLQGSLMGGPPLNLCAINQVIVFDGQEIYSGTNGLVRVGPNQQPPCESLFTTQPLSVFAFDAEYIHFASGNYLWKIHK